MINGEVRSDQVGIRDTLPYAINATTAVWALPPNVWGYLNCDREGVNIVKFHQMWRKLWMNPLSS